MAETPSPTTETPTTSEDRPDRPDPPVDPVPPLLQHANQLLNAALTDAVQTRRVIGHLRRCEPFHFLSYTNTVRLVLGGGGVNVRHSYRHLSRADRERIIIGLRSAWVTNGRYGSLAAGRGINVTPQHIRPYLQFRRYQDLAWMMSGALTTIMPGITQTRSLVSRARIAAIQEEGFL